MYNLYRLTCLIAGKSAELDEVLMIDPADVTLSRRDSAWLRVNLKSHLIFPILTRIRIFRTSR